MSDESTSDDTASSEQQALTSRLETVDRWGLSASRSLGRLLFGDRVGLTVFLAAVLWIGSLWRVGIFIQDTVTVANTLANVASGQLALEEWPYSLTIGIQPGVVEVDGQFYGRNYGQVLLTLPVLWVLQGATALVAPKLLLAGSWSLALVGFATQIQQLTGRERVGTVGSVLAVGFFLTNVATASALPDDILPLVALQLSTLLAAAFLAVVVYRLVSRFHGKRVGVAAGIATVLATPIGFWATIPKRHVLTALAAVVVLYCFAVSRTRTDRRGRLTRGGAYATLGLLTTLHPFEAFFLFVVLVPIDLLTAPENSLRTLVLVGVVFALSLLPFFALNTLIAGNPVESPRILGGSGSGIDTSLSPENGGGAGSATPTGDGSPGGSATPTGDGSPSGSSTPTDGANTSGNETASADSTGGTPGDETDTSTPGDETDADTPLFGIVAALLGVVSSIGGFAWGWVSDSMNVLGQHERLYHIFVRGGENPYLSTSLNDYEAIELSLLESFPLAGALLWLPVAAVRRVQVWSSFSDLGLSTPRRQTDVLATGFAVVFTLVYLPRLPLVSQITLRYILPIFPLLVYGVARCGFVHRVLADVPAWLVGSYLATVVVGGGVLTAVLAVLDPAIGEAMQAHALVGLATAAVGTAAVVAWPLHDDLRAVAVGVALPAGATTLFLLLAKVEYFSYRLPSDNSPNQYALDIVRVLAELLPIFPS